MEALDQSAIELLQETERYYDGTNRHEMKLAMKRHVEVVWYEIIECAPFWVALVMARALTLLDECPDYS